MHASVALSRGRGAEFSPHASPHARLQREMPPQAGVSGGRPPGLPAPGRPPQAVALRVTEQRRAQGSTRVAQGTGPERRAGRGTAGFAHCPALFPPTLSLSLDSPS